MKKMEQKRIDYIAPKIIDLGSSQSLYGQETCVPGSQAAGDGCQAGSLADGSCHVNGDGARTMCEEFGNSAGVKCKAGIGA